MDLPFKSCAIGNCPSRRVWVLTSFPMGSMIMSGTGNIGQRTLSLSPEAWQILSMLYQIIFKAIIRSVEMDTLNYRPSSPLFHTRASRASVPPAQIGAILDRVWCSGNIVDSHFSGVRRPQQPRVRLPVSEQRCLLFFPSLFS